VCIHEPLGLHSQPSMFSSHFHEVAFFQIEFIEDLLGNHNLTPLADAAQERRFGTPFRVRSSRGHAFSLSVLQEPSMVEFAYSSERRWKAVRASGHPAC